MIRAVIFDMDGVMIDSEPLQSQAYKVVLARYGIGPIREEIVQIPGLTGRDNWEIIKKKYGLTEDTDKLVQERLEVYLSILEDNLIPRSGLIDLVRILKENGYKLAVGSSSTISVPIVIEGIGLNGIFDAVVTRDEVEKAKPEPDIFLKVAEQLGVAPKKCLVIEDSAPGVEAAKRAGMKCIAVPTESTRDHDLSAADLIVNSLQEINIETVKSLCQQPTKPL